MNFKKGILLLFAALITGFIFYLFRPLSNIPEPNTFTCVDLENGSFIPRDSLSIPTNIYGMGLTYSDHLVETASTYDPDAIPPIFRKSLHTLTADQAQVRLPTKSELRSASGSLEQEVSEVIEDVDNLSTMLDYEVELGFVLLESIKSEDLERDDFVPQLGFFIANDLSSRSIAILGEGSDLKYEYWGVSKSFPGFLPISQEVWVPNIAGVNSIPCIRIETYVNGEVRQSQTTDNMIFTPLQMLRFIQEKYPNAALQKGDMVLTGTPGGVAIATPKAIVRLSNLLGVSRYKKLAVKLGGDQSAFLKEGDVVEIRGDGFQPVAVEIIN